ncbi:LPXTG cell wall anchor domain-containing protein [Kitasatospora purpeofusca]|uniref:LPXTG cell wall anchor domain-containing protein n=1 Tax=Kitasatospora purpeofusca TaxID=67352 RepID=A0ABZ1UBK5_9ACTN|nr:LPXTG cell wall anchor domain-containing protein [Kitasatospora purpeofusca]
MRTSLTARVALTAAATCLTAVSAGPVAFAAAGGTYTVPVHQNLPITAAGFGEHEATCGSIGANQDGWHFVLPGNSTDFVALTVAFDNGAPQVVTTFGPPTTKHAYVGSAPGAKLTSASAEVKGGEVRWFNLSHTCPATAVTPSGTPSIPVPSTTPTTTASPSASISPSATASPKPTATSGPSTGAPAGSSTEAAAGTSAAAGPSTSAPAGRSTEALPGGSTSTGPSTSAGAGAGTATAAAGSDSLASTGADVGLTVLAAVGLVGAGSVLVMRRRTRPGQH